MTKREVALRKEVYSFRRSLEERFDWKNHPYCFYGTCYDVSGVLYYHLIEKGFEEKHFVFGGLYVQPSKQYDEFYSSCNKKEDNHVVLIDLESKVYIDITRDQFFLYNERYYRVIIESVSDSITHYFSDIFYEKTKYENWMRTDIHWNIVRHHSRYMFCKQSYSENESLMIQIHEHYLPRILNGNIVEDIEFLDNLVNYKTHHRLRVFYEKGIRCVYCGKEGKHLIHARDRGGNRHIDLFTETFDLMTIDHILPKSKGGRDHIDNLQPMCQSCNSRKGDNYESYRVYKE